MKTINNIKMMLRAVYIDITYSILTSSNRLFVKIGITEKTTELKPQVPDMSPVTTTTDEGVLSKLFKDATQMVGKADISLGPLSIPNEHATTFYEAQPLITGLAVGAVLGGTAFGV